MSTAITDIGTKVYVKSKVSPYAFETFTSFTSVGEHKSDPETHESTDLEDLGKTYEQGRPDSPKIDFEYNYTDARNTIISAKMDGSTPQTIMVITKDGSGFYTTGVGTNKGFGAIKVGSGVQLGTVSFIQSTAPTPLTTAEAAALIPAAFGTTAVAPAASPATGDVADNSTCTLTTATSGASIFYTNDGSIPTRASSLYSVPIVITDAVVIKAVAIKAGMNDSTVTTVIYTITA